MHMTRPVSILVLGCALLACVANAAPPNDAPPPGCDHDRSGLLALDEDRFDQDFDGGWRALAAKPGCKLAAADLLRDYRQAHNNEAGILYWHEAQLRAMAGQSAAAIGLMDKSRQPAGRDQAGWNAYVDASIAFLRKDRPALEQARQGLAAVPFPSDKGMPPLKDGVVELPMKGGKTMKLRWPPNIDVVDGLIQCFDKPYEEAYGSACRPPAP
ncbi:MAG: hypothetical protein AB1584_00810 [Pseudomonadota bacterium]